MAFIKIFFVSITAYQMVGMQVKELFMFVCQNCTVITIETSPTGSVHLSVGDFLCAFF